ncbi:hypothetical protein [Bradyrhizobium japonicum]|uniref:hypothetical protein n=1 Tax=Bradyrhizobium japonicum TaxID=375 RepID=UPI001BA56E71|nr:hypothetical protein [Bradyrhizobium japonicum]MBR0913872.1 hypothetical protein [Bradyrhizobium japonicum]
MTKKDLRERVYAAADELFIERGSFNRFGYREVRERARGASNDVMVLFEEWKDSRATLMKSRPDALAAAAEDFAGRIWLMARLLVKEGPRPRDPGPAPSRVSSAHQPEFMPARPRPSQPRTRRSRTSPPGGAVRFSDLPRPERSAPKVKKGGKTRKAVLAKMSGIRLVPPRPERRPAPATDADWRGARNEGLAQAVAKLLRKKGERMRARDLFTGLPPSLRPGTVEHAHRDIQKGVAGSKIRWMRGGWFWFHGEEVPKGKKWQRLNTTSSKRRARGEALWWRVAHTIAELARPFTQAEMEAACGDELSKLGEGWLRVRLIRGRERKPPFLEFTPPDIYRWTGLPASEVAKED